MRGRAPQADKNPSSFTLICPPGRRFGELRNYYAVESWGWSRDSSLSYSLASDPVSDNHNGPAGLRATPTPDICAQSRAIYGREEYLAPGPFKCVKRRTMAIYFQLSEQASSGPDAARNSRFLAMGAGRGPPGPRIYTEDGGLSASFPGNLEESLEGSRESDEWVMESLRKIATIQSLI